MTLLVALDVIVAAMLAVTIGFCMVLNRRLAVLRRNESELREVLAKFNQAAAQAEAGIARLKDVSTETAASLGDRIGEAKALRDDLAFVTERGDRMVAELGKKMAAARSPETPRAAPRSIGAAPRELSKVERELLTALEQAR